MSASRSKPIIAIFGGTSLTEAHRFAEWAGEALAERAALVLTGGTGTLLPPDKSKRHEVRPIKESALVGAVSAVSPLRRRWIGVARSDRPNAEINEEFGGFVIATDLGHSRNYLEACLCDAALVLPGGEGTESEAMFTRACEKPVLFVGSKPGDKARVETSTRIDAARRYVDADSVHDPWLERSLSKEAFLHGLAASPEPVYLDLPQNSEQQRATAIQAVKQVLDLLGASRTGMFPPLARYDDVCSTYMAWLSDADREAAP